jgi:hypothetical protein
LWLERLGDRTLLSGFSRASDLHLLVGLTDSASLSSPDGTRLVSPPDARVEFRLLTEVLHGFVAPDLSGLTSTTAPPPSGLSGDPPGVGGYPASLSSGDSFDGPRKAQLEFTLAPVVGGGLLADELQQVLVSRSASPNLGGMEEFGKAILAQERTLSDRTVLAYLLRPYITDHGDRHSATGDGGSPFGTLGDDSARPDAPGGEFILWDRTDGPAIARSLAAVFREELPGDEAFGENPVGKTPDVLVSYEPDLLTPQAELLPLEDGNRALVAALVAGVAQKDASSAGPAQGDGTLAGCPVGIDSGAPVALPLPAEPGESETPGDPASPRAGAALPDAATGLWRIDSAHGDRWGDRPTVRLTDAIFAAGVFSLYYLVGDLGGRVRRRGGRI